MTTPKTCTERLHENAAPIFAAALAVVVADSNTRALADYLSHADFEQLRRSINDLRDALAKVYRANGEG